MSDAVFNLLNQPHVDLNQLVTLLYGNPQLAHHVGGHNRGTVWVCVQKGCCSPNHLAALTILASPPYRECPGANWGPGQLLLRLTSWHWGRIES